ncbi:CTD phosphatase Fcp1 [Gracilaria domingensis]|nr:CTD phosphatase Fcp1 [Gracilaria domingensis]
MGTRSYAAQIANIIDPHKKLFGGRITSREDFAEGRMNQKSLQRLFPCDDSMVLIVDDREDVWISGTGQSFMPNLVRASPYHFWDGVVEVYKKIYFQKVHPNAQGNSRNASPPSGHTPSSAAATGANQREKEQSNELDAAKPSENGNEVKHINGITSDLTAQPKQGNEATSTHVADEEPDHPKDAIRPESPDAATGPGTVLRSEHVVETERVDVTFNGNSQQREQNGSSSAGTEIHSPEKGPNRSQRPQIGSLESETPLQPILPSEVVAENVGPVSHDSDERKDTERVEHENPSRENQQQQPQNGSSEEEIPMQFASPNGVSTDKNASADDLLQKWWTKYIESKVPNHLLRLADVLEDCHARFFSIADQARKESGATKNGSVKGFRPPADVKKILANVRREVLSDCVISFTGVIPTGVDPRSSELWNLALRLGAQCSLDFENGHTTHLVASEERGRNTRKYKQAVENGSAFVVSPSWLEHCALHFERQDEYGYQLDCDNRFKTSEEFKSWVSNNFAKAASACRKRSAMQISDGQSGDEPTPKRRKLDSPSPSVRDSGSRSPVADGVMLSLLSQDEIGAAIEAAFAME